MIEDREDRQSGPDRLGIALWSPQRAQNDADIYANLREARPGDLVFHLVDNDSILGRSTVAGPLDETFLGAHGSRWEGSACYRLPLRDFQRLEPALKREWLFADPEIGERLRNVLAAPRSRGLFYNRNLQLNQGAYLTEVPPGLLDVLDSAYVIHAGKHLPDLLPPDQEAAVLETEEEAGGLVGDTPGHRSWVYSPGKGAVKWDEFYEGGIMAIGWDEIGPFQHLSTFEDFRVALEANLPSDKSHVQNARMCFDFAHSIQVGDIIYAKRGRDTFVGRGVVVGGYRYDTTRAEFRSVRQVRWTPRAESGSGPACCR